jgi:hypothetical protein
VTCSIMFHVSGSISTLRPCLVKPFPASNTAQPMGDTRPRRIPPQKNFVVWFPRETRYRPNPTPSPHSGLWTPGINSSSWRSGKNPTATRARGEVTREASRAAVLVAERARRWRTEGRLQTATVDGEIPST